MSEELNMKQAQNVYETFCKSLDARGWKYTRHEEDLVITCGVRGEDLPMDLVIIVNPKAQVVSVISQMPFSIPEDKRAEMAMAVCVANNGLINGTFDFNVLKGDIRFRVVSSYRESILSEELFNYMIVIAAGTVDQYNDKFLMIAKGMMTIQQLIESENA